MIPDKIPKQEYTDLNGKVLFPFQFDVVTSDSVKVEIKESGQESGTIIDPTSYTVELLSGGSAPAAGNVRFHEPLSVQGGTMTIFRQTEFSQEVELGNGSQFYPKVVESAIDKLTMITQELKGGVVTTKQGESYAYAESAGVAVSLREGAVVDSAEHASVAEFASSFAEGATIENAEHAARATVAESATMANTAGGLTPLAKADIIASAGGEGGSVLLGAKAYAVMPNMQGGQQIFSANTDKTSTYTTSSGAAGALGNGYGGVLILHGELDSGYDSDDGFKMTNLTGYGSAIHVVDPESCGEGAGDTSAYTGPFALTTYGSGADMTAGMNSGYVWAGGSHYLVSGFASDEIPFPENKTAYLTLSSGGGVISSGFTTTSTGLAEGTVVVRIGSRGVDTDNTEQLQFGDITTVPWGIGGGAGGINAPDWSNISGGTTGGGWVVTEIVSNTTPVVTAKDGWVYAFAEFTEGTVDPASAEAHIVINGAQFKVASLKSANGVSNDETRTVGGGIVIPVITGSTVGFSVVTLENGTASPGAYIVNAGCVLYTK